MTLESQIQELDQEANALKIAFEKTAAQLPVFTEELDFSTSENRLHQSYNGYETDLIGDERIIVSYDTETGLNTLATLEVGGVEDAMLFKYRRIPYDGGAAWELHSTPIPNQETGEWEPARFHFVVHAAVKGTLKARMIWEQA